MSWDATQLVSNDNVATVLRPVAAGETVRVLTPSGVAEVIALEAIPLCHKIAVQSIEAGHDVLKYGGCIGEARAPIERGAWVHVHNIVSKRGQLRSSRL